MKLRQNAASFINLVTAVEQMENHGVLQGMMNLQHSYFWLTFYYTHTHTNTSAAH